MWLRRGYVATRSSCERMVRRSHETRPRPDVCTCVCFERGGTMFKAHNAQYSERKNTGISDAVLLSPKISQQSPLKIVEEEQANFVGELPRWSLAALTPQGRWREKGDAF